MKEKEIYKKAIDEICKERINCRFFANENQYGITHDGCAAYFFKKDKFLLSVDESKAANLDAVIPKDRSDYKPAEITCYVEKDKKQYAKLENKYTHCYVNKNYIKYFEAPYFEIKDAKSIVLVFEFGELKGIVCPCKID